jgi:hypothetical protein
MSCPCDQHAAARGIDIPPGLDALPLQRLGFPETIASLLAKLPDEVWLGSWRARSSHDLGRMLLEMWAYVADDLSFYDQVRADEVYLRTAVLRTSLRRIVDLLGYLPRPAVGATVKLGLIAEGRRPLVLPAGSGFRSGAFGTEPPQVFEIGAPVTIHPDANAWPVIPPRATILSGSVDALLLVGDTARVRPRDRLLITLGGASPQRFARSAVRVEQYVEGDLTRWLKVKLDIAISVSGTAPLDGARVDVPGRTASLWTHAHAPGEPDAITSRFGATKLLLDGLYRQIAPGDAILLSRGAEVRWFAVADRDEPVATLLPAPPSIKIDGKDVTFPPIKVPVTRLTLDTTLDHPTRKASTAAAWGTLGVSSTLVHFALAPAGTIGAAAKKTLAPGDALFLAGTRVAPSGPPSPKEFLFASADHRGAAAGGALDFGTGHLTLNPDVVWTPELELPVITYGNVITATRGESVRDEILGGGDGNLAWQSFKPKKKPLTYLPHPTDERGVASTLSVSVSGVRWTEVSSLYGQPPDAQVYVVHQNDDGDSIVTFGDGRNGSRLPSGIDNVVASYRFGAGKASPPAGSIVQLAKAVTGLQTVVNPVASAGGDDAEPARKIRRLAPRSALLLGRAISVADFEAAAAGVPGARAAVAEWRWSSRAQRPLVHVYYVGATGLQALVSQCLRALSEPSLSIQVEPATALPTVASIDLETDARRVGADLAAVVHDRLLDPDRGLLAPEQIGIGAPLFRSRLFQECLAVPGVLGVRSIIWRGAPFREYAVSPGGGAYFDLEAGRLEVHATPSEHG